MAVANVCFAEHPEIFMFDTFMHDITQENMAPEVRDPNKITHQMQ